MNLLKGNHAKNPAMATCETFTIHAHQYGNMPSRKSHDVGVDSKCWCNPKRWPAVWTGMFIFYSDGPLPPGKAGVVFVHRGRNGGALEESEAAAAPVVHEDVT